MPDLIFGLLPLDRPLEATDDGHDLLVGHVRRQQEDPSTQALDLHLITRETKFLGQAHGLAVAMLEYLGGLHRVFTLRE